MATIKEVAALAGVSLSTVSIVVNGRGEERKISPETCQRVWNAAKSLNYQPNIAARKLRENDASNTLTIALFWANDFRTTMLSRFLKGMQQALEGREDVEIIVMPYQNDHLNRQKSLLGGRRFHGAIVANASRLDMDFLNTVSLPAPVVVYNRHTNRYPSVCVDDEKMGRSAASVLLSKGKLRAALLTSPYIFPGMELRDRGFCKAFAEAGFPVPKAAVFVGENAVSGGVESCQRMLTQQLRCDAVFCSSDAIALGALYTLRQVGIRVPEEMAVIAIGAGESEYTRYAAPPLSSVWLPMEDMAAQCIGMTLKLIDRQPLEQEHLILDTPLLLRESTEG